MKKIIFEVIRTVYFVAMICASLLFLGVAVNEIWLIHLKFKPIFPELISAGTGLRVFQIMGATAVITMPIFLFGMASKSYSKRQTVADGETVVKISMVFALFLVVVPTLLMLFQERWEHLAYFAGYWVVVVIVGRWGKYSPTTPALVFCLERTANRLGLPK